MTLKKPAIGAGALKRAHERVYERVYERAYRGLFDFPIEPSWGELSRSTLVSALRDAAVEGNPEDCKLLLSLLLRKVKVQLPKGVLIPLRRKPGRHRIEKTELIVLKWIEIGRPSLTRQLLARAYFGEAFICADSAEKERMVNQCRRAVQRRVPPDQIHRPNKSGEKSRLN